MGQCGLSAVGKKPGHARCSRVPQSGFVCHFIDQGSARRQYFRGVGDDEAFSVAGRRGLSLTGNQKSFLHRTPAPFLAIRRERDGPGDKNARPANVLDGMTCHFLVTYCGSGQLGKPGVAFVSWMSRPSIAGWANRSGWARVCRLPGRCPIRTARLLPDRWSRGNRRPELESRTKAVVC